EPAAVCLEEPNAEANKELAVRVRIITQTFAALWRNRAMLNPLRHGFYAGQLLSHKVVRYLAPVFLMILLTASGILAVRNVWYASAFGAQVAFYFIAVVSWLLEKAGVQTSWLALPQYFVITNLASLIAFVKFLRGERYIKWEPLREPQSTSAQVNTPTIISTGQRGAQG